MSRRAGMLLAAGSSRRLGRDKRLVVVAGESLLRRAARSLAAVASPAVVVLPEPRAELLRELAGLAVQPVHDPETRRGMGRSLAIGAAALAARGVAAGVVLVALVDQPGVDADALAGLVAAAESGEGWAVADYGDGAWGPPVCLPASALAEVAALDGDRGARALVERHGARVRRHPLPAARADLDLPADYAELEGAGEG